MDDLSTTLLRRVRLVAEDVASRRLELSLDGWPLLIVDAAAQAVFVNDLRASRHYPHAVELPAYTGRLIIQIDAVGDELFVLLGEVAAVFVTVDYAWETHADVKVVESPTGRVLFERPVRYRQLSGWRSPSSVSAIAGR